MTLDTIDLYADIVRPTANCTLFNDCHRMRAIEYIGTKVPQ